MKFNLIIKSLLLCTFLIQTSPSFAQAPIETSFEVSSVCEMCTARIEKAVDVKGVKTAEYDLDTHLLSIVYSPKHITEDEIHALLNAVGHDTEKSKASDEEYNSVHGCCKYRSDAKH